MTSIREPRMEELEPGESSLSSRARSSSSSTGSAALRDQARWCGGSRASELPRRRSPGGPRRVQGGHIVKAG